MSINSKPPTPSIQLLDKECYYPLFYQPVDPCEGLNSDLHGVWMVKQILRSPKKHSFWPNSTDLQPTSSRNSQNLMHGHGSIIPPGLFFRNRTTFPVTGESPCFILDLLNDAGQKYRKHVSYLKNMCITISNINITYDNTRKKKVWDWLQVVKVKQVRWQIFKHSWKILN